MEKNEYLKQLDAGEEKGKGSQIEFTQLKLDMTNDSIEAYEKEIEAMTKIMEVCMAKPKTLNPKYEYETDDEYWKYNTQLYEVTAKRKISDINIKLLQAQDAKEKVSERLAELKGE